MQAYTDSTITVIFGLVKVLRTESCFHQDQNDRGEVVISCGYSAGSAYYPSNVQVYGIFNQSNDSENGYSTIGSLN